MYSHYIPAGATFSPVSPPDTAPPPPPKEPSFSINSLLNQLTSDSESNHTIQDFLRRFHLENLGTGDVLLALILLILILEDGDELELIITLGLMLLFSLGER